MIRIQIQGFKHVHLTKGLNLLDYHASNNLELATNSPDRAKFRYRVASEQALSRGEGGESQYVQV